MGAFFFKGFFTIFNANIYMPLGFPHGSAGKESACNMGDVGLIPGLGRCPGEGNSYPPSAGPMLQPLATCDDVCLN